MGAGPLAGSGPLVGAGPLQGAAPVTGSGAIAVVGPVMSFGLPNSVVSFRPILASLTPSQLLPPAQVAPLVDLLFTPSTSSPATLLTPVGTATSVAQDTTSVSTPGAVVSSTPTFVSIPSTPPPPANNIVSSVSGS